MLVAQSCPSLCNPMDCSLPGSSIHGILQARTLEWVAISFPNAGKWKGKWNRSVVSDPQRPHGLQPSRLLYPWDFPGKSTGVGCHCLLRLNSIVVTKPWACQGKEATATAITTLLDLTANQTLSVLLFSIQVPRFSGLSNSNAIHSTNIYRGLPICQILSETLDLPG